MVDRGTRTSPVRALVDRALEVYRHMRTDTYVLSFPKSGRTWLRVLLAKAFALHFETGGDFVFDPSQAVKGSGGAAPRLYFDHDGTADPAASDKQGERRYRKYRKKRVLFLVRDPRDVLVSVYFQRTKRFGEAYEMSALLRDSRWGIDRIIRFMNGWLAHRIVPSAFTMVRYEDMHRDIERELRGILGFVGVPGASDDTIRQASEYAAFDSMKKMAMSEFKGVEILKPKDPNDPETHKVRRGKVGGYVDYLTAADIAFLVDKIRSDLNPEFGYS